MIPFVNLEEQQKRIQSKIQENLSNVFSHGQYIQGPEVKLLEDKLSIYVGSNFCVSTSSGTDALLISLMALGVKPGDEVITSAFSFISAAEMITLLGAKPVLIDIDPTSCNIDPSLIESQISNKTKAIIPVSLYGQVSDMDEINQIGKKYSIPVIEDAAQSFGASYKNRRSCNLSDIAVTSFFPSKPLGCYGDGGAIFVNDEKLANQFKEIRAHGQRERYSHWNQGLCARLDTVQAAILLAKLEIFDNELNLRQDIANIYDENFDRIGIKRLDVKSYNKSVYAQYSIFCSDRNKLQDFLKVNEIPSSIHYPRPISDQPFYKSIINNNNFPNSINIAKSILHIPMCPYLNQNNQNKIISKVDQFINNA